jgi:hypothetical protein
LESRWSYRRVSRREAAFSAFDHLRKHGHDAGIAPAVADFAGEEVLVGDLILCEVLQGLRANAEAMLVEEASRELAVVSLVDAELAS